MLTVLKSLFKLILAIALVWWLISSGKLDFSLTTRSLKEGYGWLYCMGILVLVDALSSFRWKWLLQTSSKARFPNLKMIKLTWIGLFFNTFLPGAVTGDFIKLLYAKDLDRSFSKTFLVTSVLIDRILGLTGLLMILGFSSIIYYQDVTSISSDMKHLVHFNLFLFAGAIVFILTLFSPKKIQTIVLSIATKVPVLGERIIKTLKGFWSIGSQKKTIIQCILLSCFLQAMNFLAFYLVSSPFYEKPIPYEFILTFIPVGFMAIAIPISPAGIGVGHLIFDRLFSLVGVSGGASFFNLFFLCQVFINLLGVIPYLLSGKEHSLSEAEKFHDEAV